MTEFHEVECPDQIGRVAGFGRSASTQINKKSAHFCGGRILAERFLIATNIQMLFFIVECCCILIIYYCWQASSATLPSRARRMTSFVKIFRSVGVERLSLRSVLLLLTLFFTCWTLLFDAPAQCLSVGWSWRASRMITFFKKSSIS